MRFLKQTNEYTCGPVAIINCLKDHGYSFTKADLPEISHQVDCDPVFGTNQIMTLAYLSEFLKFRIILEPKLSDLTDKFLMLYETSQVAHIVYVTKKENYYIVTNYLNESSRKFIHELMTPEEIVTLLRFQDSIIPNIIPVFA